MEPGQRAAPGHGQARPRRPRLHAHHVRRLGLAAAVPADGRARHPDRAGAARPRQRVGVRAAHRRREERLRADPASRSTTQLDAGALAHGVRRADRRRRATALAARGLRRGRRTSSRAPPTCATSARPSRCGCRCPTATLDRAALDGVAAAFHAEHRGLYGYDFAGDPTQQVEWVNLRVSGIGPITRPEIRRVSPGRAARGDGERLARRTTRRRPVCFDADEGYVDTPVLLAHRPGPGRQRRGAGDHRGVRLDGAAAPGLHRHRRRLRQPAGTSYGGATR